MNPTQTYNTIPTPGSRSERDKKLRERLQECLERFNQKYTVETCQNLHAAIQDLKNSYILTPEELEELSYHVFPGFLHLRYHQGIEYFLQSLPYMEKHNIHITNPKLLSIEWLLHWKKWIFPGEKWAYTPKNIVSLKKRMLPILFKSQSNDALAMLYFLEIAKENRSDAELFHHDATQALNRLFSNPENSDNRIILQLLYDKKFYLPRQIRTHLLQSFKTIKHNVLENPDVHKTVPNFFKRIQHHEFSDSIADAEELDYELRAFQTKEDFEKSLSHRHIEKRLCEIVAAIIPATLILSGWAALGSVNKI